MVLCMLSHIENTVHVHFSANIEFQLQAAVPRAAVD